MTQVDNQTMKCEDSQVEIQFALVFVVNLQILYYIFCLFFGVFLNLIAILLILCHKELQNITFMLAFQLLISDLLSASVIFPTSAANAVANRNLFTDLCSVISFIFYFMRNVRIYLMSGLIADRFISTFKPFWYQRNRVSLITLISLGAWVFSSISALVPVRGLLDCYAFLHVTWTCVPNGAQCPNKTECSIYSYSMVAFSQALNVMILLLYIVLFITVRNKITTYNSDQERAAAVKKRKREHRANITFFLLFLALLMVSIPFGKIILDVLGVPQQSTLYTLAGIMGWAAYHLLVIIDPLIIMRNGDFRSVITKTLNQLNFTRNNGN